MNNTPQSDWYEKVPKVELHLHLEGAIPLDSLWELVQKYGGDSTLPNIEAIQRRFAYRDFPHFIETWIWKNQFLREYEDFTFIAEAFARDLERQSIRYAEVFFSPLDFAQVGLSAPGLAAAIRKGLARVPGTQIQLICDFGRDWGPEKAAAGLAALIEARDQGVIGIGIGGSEQTFPPEPFQAVYAEARRLGFHTTAHAGEAAGAESIWGALNALQVERIGHGARAGEDERLLDTLAEKQIPIEMCPLSNVRTGVIPSIDSHPIRRFYERGLMVTVNTDDPKMFGNRLAEEYQLLETHLGFTHDDIRTLILNGIRSSWLPGDAKQRLIEEYRGDPNWM